MYPFAISVVQGSSSFNRGSRRTAEPSIETKANSGKFVIDTEHDAWILTRVPALHRIASGRENKLIAVQYEHIGATWGRPTGRRVASLAVRVPDSKKARHSFRAIVFMYVLLHYRTDPITYKAPRVFAA
jgi:hypothetical protein